MMSARSRRFGASFLGSTRGQAVGAAVACAAMLLAGCGGSDEADAGAPVIRGDVTGGGCEAATGSWTATAAVGGVTRTVVFSAPTYTSPWTTFTATSNTGQSATISSSSSSGSIQVRGLTKKANNTFIVTGTTANGCTYTSPPSITVSGPEEVGAPGVPTISTVTAGDAKVTVTVAAASTGATPASYTVTASPAAGTCTVTGESGSCDVTGLTNGTAYTFTATATSAGGTSSASAPSAPVTPVTVPGAPTIGAVNVSGSTSATVAFTAPASNGGSPITKYTATSNTGAITGTVSQAGSGTITVTGLTANTTYTFTVTATNAKGTSAASTTSAQVTVGPLGAPRIDDVTPTGPTTATVAFTAPASDGGSYIRSYTATSDPIGGTGTVAQSHGGTITVTGLKPGIAYTFKVSATNALGTTESAASMTLVQLPAVPVLLTADAGVGKVTVTVTAGTPGGTPTSISVMAVTRKSGSPVSGASCTVYGTYGSCDVPNLKAGTEYQFKGMARNTAGNTDWSARSLTTTPK